MKRFFAAFLMLFLTFTTLAAEEITLKIPRGGNLSLVLKEAEIPMSEVNSVLKALSSHINLRKIKPSQEIRIITDRNAGENGKILKELVMETSFDERITVRHNGWSYEAFPEKLELRLIQIGRAHV